MIVRLTLGFSVEQLATCDGSRFCCSLLSGVCLPSFGIGSFESDIGKLAFANGRKGDAVAPSLGHSPLRGKAPGVLVQQAFCIDAIARERPAAEVVDKEVVSNGQLEACSACALSEIVVVEEAEPESLVKPADLCIDGPRNEQAEPGKLGHGEPLPAVFLAPASRESVHFFQIAVGHGVD